METCQELIVGKKQRFEASFYRGDPENDGVLTDPTAVKFIYKKPSDVSPTVFTFGVGAEIVRDEAGVFHVEIEYTESGVWYWRFESSGTVVAASQGKVQVKAERPMG